MSFTKEKIKDFYLFTTDVENIFINEYMPTAPGEYVKVFLYGLLYSQNPGEMTHAQMARQLGMSEEQLEEAWIYWENLGVVTKKYIINSGSYGIEFKNLRSLMYSGELNAPKKEEQNVSADVLTNNALKELTTEVEVYFGRPLSSKELLEVGAWLEEIGATKEVITGAVEYCIEKGKKSINYITKVVLQWTKDGFKTSEDIKNHLTSLEERFGNYKKILQSLGLNRGVTEAERKMIDSWFDEMHFNMERVMDACARGSFTQSPNIRYVNKVLINWYEEAKIDGRNVNKKVTISNADLNKYYEYLRGEAEAKAAERKEEIYNLLPRVKEIDQELLDLGMKLSRTLLSRETLQIDKIKKQIGALEEERAVLFTENNYREDYTDIKYACDKCNDTGVTEEGGRCTCVGKRMGEAELWQNSSSSKN